MTERLKGKALSEDVVAPSPRHGENTTSFPVFPLAGFMAEAIGYPFGALGRFHVKSPFRLREAGGRCEGVSTIYLPCSMPDRACLKL